MSSDFCSSQVILLLAVGHGVTLTLNISAKSFLQIYSFALGHGVLLTLNISAKQSFQILVLVRLAVGHVVTLTLNILGEASLLCNVTGLSERYL